MFENKKNLPKRRTGSQHGKTATKQTKTTTEPTWLCQTDWLTYSIIARKSLVSSSLFKMKVSQESKNTDKVCRRPQPVTHSSFPSSFLVVGNNIILWLFCLLNVMCGCQETFGGDKNLCCLQTQMLKKSLLSPLLETTTTTWQLNDSFERHDDREPLIFGIIIIFSREECTHKLSCDERK